MLSRSSPLGRFSSAGVSIVSRLEPYPGNQELTYRTKPGGNRWLLCWLGVESRICTGGSNLALIIRFDCYVNS